MEHQFDAITLEIYWSRLIAVADEAATALYRTAFSPIIRESNDFATCLMNVKGETIAESTRGIPAFAGLIGRACQYILKEIPIENWREGDCVFTNDPWIATGHLPDIAFIVPIFHRGNVVAFSGTAAHTPDIGGTVGTENQEIFEEGVFIPPVHFARSGIRNEDMLKLFLSNVRDPDLMLGDIEAQLTANEVCRERAIEFLTDTGLADFSFLSKEIHRASETSMRRAIDELPDGVYKSQISLDGFEGLPTTIQCVVTISGSSLLVDYAGSSPQISRAINCTLNYTQAYTVYPLKCILDPYTRRNEGSYRPITVQAPQGCIVNAQHPAPVAARHISGHVLSCAIFQALAEILPDAVLADSGGAPALRALIGGVDNEGDQYSTMLFASAGMGASSKGDGLSTTAFPTNSGAGSLEILEASAPLLFRQKTFLTDSGGAGEYRGGLGQIIEIENRSKNPAHIVIVGERGENPARGLLGGSEGAVASAMISNSGPVSLKSKNLLKTGASVSIKFAGGGGYGSPEKRRAELVLKDLEHGLISHKVAQMQYGKILD